MIIIILHLSYTAFDIDSLISATPNIILQGLLFKVNNFLNSNTLTYAERLYAFIYHISLDLM